MSEETEPCDYCNLSPPYVKIKADLEAWWEEFGMSKMTNILQAIEAKHDFIFHPNGVVQCSKCYVVAHYWQGKYVADDNKPCLCAEKGNSDEVS